MSKVLLSGRNGVIVPTGNTVYMPLAYDETAFTTLEAISQITSRTNGTFKNALFYVSANAATGAGTYTTRINSVNGNITLSITGSTTGLFEDTSNTDIIKNGDTIGAQFIVGTGGSTTITLHSTIFDKSGSAWSFFGGTTGFSSSANTGTTFLTLTTGNNGGSIATETIAQIIINGVFTVYNFQLYCSANARTTTTTLRVRKNSANGNGVISLGAGITGFLEDTTDIDSFILGDAINYARTNGASAESYTIRLISTQWSSKNKFNVPAGDLTGVTIATGVTDYFSICSCGLATTTETNVALKVRFPFSISYLRITIGTNTTTGSSTYDLRVNSASSALTISIASVTTGTFQDLTHIVNVINTDTINHRVVNGGGGNLIPVERSMLMADNSFSTTSSLLLLGIG